MAQALVALKGVAAAKAMIGDTGRAMPGQAAPLLQPTTNPQKANPVNIGGSVSGTNNISDWLTGVSSARQKSQQIDPLTALTNPGGYLKQKVDTNIAVLKSLFGR